MIGRVDRLDVRQGDRPLEGARPRLSQILYQPTLPAGAPLRCVATQDHGLERALDNELIARARPALEQRAPVEISTCRSATSTAPSGTMLGSR